MNMGDAVDEQIYVQVGQPWAGQVGEDELRNAAVATLQLGMGVLEGDAERTEMSIVVVDDDVMQQLNRDYRNVDESTDVLSFGHEAAGFVMPSEQDSRYLGDVVISYPRALRQAEEAGHGVKAELTLLVAHGVLHLLGYDHADAEGRHKMWDMQDQVLQSLGFHGVRPNEGE